MQHNEDKNFLLPDESNEGAAEVPDGTVEDTMVVTVPVKWHTCKSDNICLHVCGIFSVFLNCI